jgi:DNA-binding IclR family transcriptional regulator
MHTRRGEYRLGTSAITLSEGLSLDDILAHAARRHLRLLSKQVRNHVHLGVWSDRMVTYLVKQKFGKARLHSAEGTQLEGYCSALGKVLLSDLSPMQLDNYIAEGNFVSLTHDTIVDPDQLRHEIDLVRARRWACDDQEFLSGLRCIAVPLTNPSGKVIAAISISTFLSKGVPTQVEDFLPQLQATADAITAQLFR